MAFTNLQWNLDHKGSTNRLVKWDHCEITKERRFNRPQQLARSNPAISPWKSLRSDSIERERDKLAFNLEDPAQTKFSPYKE